MSHLDTLKTGENVVCLYHAQCSDGIGAAWVVWKNFPDARFIAVTHDQPLPEGLEDKVVFIVDFSYKFDPLCELIGRCRSLILLDHHEGAQHVLANVRHLIASGWQRGKHIELTYDKLHSGAIITWRYFYGLKRPPLLLSHIEDRDLFAFKLPKTKEVMATLNVYDWDIEIINQFIETDPDCEKMAEKGPLILQANQTGVDFVLGNCVREMTLGEHTVQVANCPYWLRNEVCDALAETNPFTAVYHDTAEHRIFSLRSKKDGGMNVIPIAHLYGGSGHKNACGFRVTRDHPLAQL
jgi:oligoribonuclease NrnB/cAMP/cGMP phosphodiesterase (DHH superfamily)